MKQQPLPAKPGNKLTRNEMKKIKGGLARLACTIEQQEECSNECGATCGGWCNQLCRCIC